MKTYKNTSDLKSAIKAINPVFFDKKALKWLNITEFKKIGNSGAFYQGAEVGTWARNTLKFFDGVTIHSTEIKDFNHAKNFIKLLDATQSSSNAGKIRAIIKLIDDKMDFNSIKFICIYWGLKIEALTIESFISEAAEILATEEKEQLLKVTKNLGGHKTRSL